ncbi:MFS transporter [Streptomyces phaeoluteigriseus]|uniref:MFS transporter n=1 Tax=Streptomyces phaeoluteigriseus TaxID=114686 RepID=A0ABY4ZAV0_9ACTN|nr:MFS transporter [Streptomyces phaeoluteigriseus]USQ85640.1 MFS transporter [Streptomyces phaeoluteigriseus]
MSGNTQSAAPPAPTYRDVLRREGGTVWYAAMGLIRTPVAMAPLALVFLGHSTGSFSAGGVMAAAHALGEAVGAPFMGRGFDRKPFLGQLRFALLAEALAFAALAVLAGHSPMPLLVALAFAAGAVAAGVPGGMRAQLSSTTPEHLRPTALGLESALNQAVWACGPVLASLVSTQVSPRVALALMAVASAAPLLMAGRIRHRSPASREQDRAPAGTLSVIRMAWPTVLLAAAIMFLVGAMDVALPARLETTGQQLALTGVITGVFAVASIAAGLVYGRRVWPGTPGLQTLVLLPAMTVALTLCAVTGRLWGFFAAFLLGGLFYSPLMIIRNLALQHRLPENVWATGFSLLYAAGGLGYGAAALLTAGLIEATTPAVAIVVCTAVTTLIGLIAGLGERATVSRVRLGRE